MGTLGRAAGTVVVFVFLLLTVLRPLFRNPALADAGVEDVLAWPQVLLYAPLLAVVCLLFVLGVLAMVRDEGFPARRGPHSPSERPAAPGDGSEDELDRFAGHPDLSSRFRTGDRDATGSGDIEEEPPDAALSDHLEHLRTELGDDADARGELRALEDVARETENRELPARCPDCDAAWTERTILGVKTGRYERLDGEVVCLACESSSLLEEFE